MAFLGEQIFGMTPPSNARVGHPLRLQGERRGRHAASLPARPGQILECEMQDGRLLQMMWGEL